MRNGLALSDTFTLLILMIHSVLSSIDPGGGRTLIMSIWSKQAALKNEGH
jgi:hypothetical protein